ncbi:MAG: glycosyltransferase family 2 protein [Bacteroidota bacterium]
MINTPLVSVLLPCYNAEAYIADAVWSILEQTYTNLELFIIDDSSTDRTVATVKNFNDDRIHLVEKPQNTGYTDSLNMGLTFAKGKYIARMDADDISESNRFQRQVDYLEAHPDTIVCGCWITLIPQETVYRYPVEHLEIVEELFSRNSFAHPGVMMRKSAIDLHSLNYDRSFEPTEDYELWTRMMMLGTLHNLPETLLRYRTHEQQISSYKASLQKQNRLRTRMQLLQKLLDEPLTINLLEENIYESGGNNATRIKELNLRLDKLSTLSIANHSQQLYPVNIFDNYLLGLKKKLCRSLTSRQHKSSVSLWFDICFQAPVFFRLIGWRNSLSFSARCFLNQFIF